MPLDLYSETKDDAPATAESSGFSGADFATKADALAPDLIAAGENVYADESGYLTTRPGLRWVTLCHDEAVTSGTAPQGIAYYDTPQTEQLIVARDGLLYSVADDVPGAATTLVGGTPPVLSTTAPVRFAQLVDRLFHHDDAAGLRWSLYAGGVWTHGAVAAFANTDAMPAWGGIVAHGLRLFAWTADGARLYASAIGEAHLAANWTKTDNLRFGIGEGDPIMAAVSSQGGNLLVFTRAAVYAVDARAAAVADWTITNVSRLAGCAAARSVVAFGQDVLFLTRHGVVALGALADDVSINPAETVSAPMQPLIDRINWNAREAIHATIWRDFYLLALPLDNEETASVWLPYNVRTRRWAAPWRSTLAGLVLGDYEGAILRDEEGALLADAGPTALVDSGVAPGTVDTLTSTGWSAAVVCHFSGRQETLLADDAGRILRIDPAHEQDDPAPDFSQEIQSWATLKAQDFGLPQHPKQPFTLEAQFYASTATGLQIAYVPDGELAFPSIALADAQRIETGTATGALGVFPLRFPLRFRAASLTRKQYHIRRLPRFRSASIQLYAARGRMRLRSVRMSAFVDTPELSS
jgi:hypothetical protein